MTQMQKILKIVMEVIGITTLIIGDEIWKLSHTCITGKAVLLDIVHLYPL